MAEWLRHPSVETLVVTGSDPGLAKYLFLHFFLTKSNTVECRLKQIKDNCLEFSLIMTLIYQQKSFLITESSLTIVVEHKKIYLKNSSITITKAQQTILRSIRHS